MQKKEQEKEQTLVMDFIKILFVMYFITCILLLLLAFVLYKAQPGEMVSKVWLIAVYIISGLAGGFLIGKRLRCPWRDAVFCDSICCVAAAL